MTLNGQTDYASPKVSQYTKVSTTYSSIIHISFTFSMLTSIMVRMRILYFYSPSLLRVVARVAVRIPHEAR